MFVNTYTVFILEIMNEMTLCVRWHHVKVLSCDLLGLCNVASLHGSVQIQFCACGCISHKYLKCTIYKAGWYHKVTVSTDGLCVPSTFAVWKQYRMWLESQTPRLGLLCLLSWHVPPGWASVPLALRVLPWLSQLLLTPLFWLLRVSRSPPQWLST